MKRPWQVWLVFVICVGAAAAAMAWLTKQAMHADEMRRAAEAHAELEQRISLALWRMDTELAPIIAGEVIRGPAMYRSAFFLSPNTPRQQDAGSPRNQADLPPGNGSRQVSQPSVTLKPSPLLIEPPPYVIVNFEASPAGRWRSPQVPEANQRELAVMHGLSPALLADREAQLNGLAAALDLGKLVAMLPESVLPSFADVGSNTTALANAETIARVNELNQGLSFYAGNTANLPAEVVDEFPNPKNPAPQELNVKGAMKGAPQQQFSKVADYDERTRRYQAAAQQTLFDQRSQFNPANPSSPVTEETAERVGVSRPVWIDDRLLLVRRVQRNDSTFVQGCQLDWPKLKTRLLAGVVDLIGEADFLPVTAAETERADPGRMLAGLPVRLVVHDAAGATATLSPTLRWALWIGWGSLLLATVAAAMLLGGVMALSERRAAFVSSVTHELRTPLTTFRMYAEMLARGMVPDEKRRQQYLHTLEREAERLTHLVENVLAYARLERGRKPHKCDDVTPAALLERVGPRLAHRARQANMRCEIAIAQAAANARLRTDQSVVEQILFNLVDNAAKYARHADDRRIHVAVAKNGAWIEFIVRDHGPGIAKGLRQLRPFAKSAEESAETAPGVGLGLALCRRLARQLGGRLEIAPANGAGARVTLKLPG
jgi:signal transduction histidine kinase